MKKTRFQYVVILLVGFFSFFAKAENEGPFFRTYKNQAHTLEIINSGSLALRRRLELIEKAKKSIDIEYFIYRTDVSSRLLGQKLVEKAKQGVKVRLFFDNYIIKKEIDRYHLEVLEENGVEIRYFNTTSLIRFKRSQYRNHRKVFLVDNQTVIIGGRNIGDEYFDLSKDYNFLDRDVLLEGPIVEDIAKTFNILWNNGMTKTKEYAEVPSMRGHPQMNKSGYEQRKAFYKKKMKRARAFLKSDEETQKVYRNIYQERISEELDAKGVCQNLTWISDSVDYKKGKHFKVVNRVKKYLYDLMKNAEDVYLESPYFIVDFESADVLSELAKRKAKTAFLTNGLYSTDAIYIPAVAYDHMKGWIDEGMNFYLFKGAPLYYDKNLSSDAQEARWGIHGKSGVFDNKDIMIGTYNLDPRSANLNLEMSIFCHDNKDLAEKLKISIQRRLEGSSKISTREDLKKAKFENTGLFKKLLYLLIKGPAHLLDHLL